MSTKKRSFSPEFKTKVVLELLSGEQTLAQVASKYEITPNSLNQWKKRFLENASMAFDVGKATQAFKEEIADLKKENDASPCFRKGSSVSLRLAMQPCAGGGLKSLAKRPLRGIGLWESRPPIALRGQRID